MERRRVVITGMGSINPLGHSIAETWTRLVAGESGIDRITAFDPVELGLKTHIAGEVKHFDPVDYIDAKSARRMDRFCQLAVVAANEAIANAQLPINEHTRERIGVLFATGVGGLETIVEQETLRVNKGPQRVSPLSVPMLMPNAAAGHIGLQHGLRGLGVALASACASSNDAIGMALAAIQLGWADAVIAGGAEAAVVPLAIAGFNQAGALSTRYNETPQRASRPFDKDRDGFVISEMGTALILEDLEWARRRGARIWAELAGYGASMDAYHLTAPAPDGSGAVQAIRAALANAQMAPEEIDYISAHGTGTPINDPIETLAIKQVFGERAARIPVSSIKSMVGHSAGACGALEAATCAMSLQEGILPPTINYEHPDPECDLDYVPNEARRVEIRAALSNNFGFGGHNSCIILRHLNS
ncbi:MAG TPA: beta-ketoacyl-ACP synthase II [Chloroflexota bacterium]|nr:beta-ketoacyl-ACP synthase II [Chloroflexota bacterium]